MEPGILSISIENNMHDEILLIIQLRTMEGNPT